MSRESKCSGGQYIQMTKSFECTLVYLVFGGSKFLEGVYLYE